VRPCVSEQLQEKIHAELTDPDRLKLLGSSPHPQAPSLLMDTIEVDRNAVAFIANFTVDLQQGAVQRLFGREYVVDDYTDDLPFSGTAAALPAARDEPHRLGPVGELLGARASLAADDVPGRDRPAETARPRRPSSRSRAGAVWTAAGAACRSRRRLAPPDRGHGQPSWARRPAA